jgi:hypothetical protein
MPPATRGGGAQVDPVGAGEWAALGTFRNHLKMIHTDDMQMWTGPVVASKLD